MRASLGRFLSLFRPCLSLPQSSPCVGTLVIYGVLASSASTAFAEQATKETQVQSNGDNSDGAASGAPKTGVLGDKRLPSDEQLLALIRSTLIALNQANATGNYSVFRELGAPGFQVANSTAKLAESFAELRSRNFDLSPILLLQAKLLRRPRINDGGMLRITGFFATRPEQVNFDLMFQDVDGKWRLFGIAANTATVQPATQAK